MCEMCVTLHNCKYILNRQGMTGSFMIILVGMELDMSWEGLRCALCVGGSSIKLGWEEGCVGWAFKWG